MLESIDGDGFMRYCDIFFQNISFYKLIITSGNRYFLQTRNVINQALTIELRAVQTITTRPSSFLGNRVATSSSATSYVHLRIREGSAGVNAAGRTWAGMWFASITLIDEHGNAV